MHRLPLGTTLACGDFVDSDDECDVEAEAEPRQRYAEGLYCPLFIGELLHNRYRLQHKIGWGGFSTVWLAHDNQQDNIVALKVGALGHAAEYERQILDEIIRTVPDTTFLLTYQQSFYIHGHKGNLHLVLVFPLRGSSLYTYNLSSTWEKKNPSFRVPGAMHLLLALKGLHDAGIVHRDLNDGAILWNIKSMEGWTPAQVDQCLGRPRKVLLKEEEGGPAELVETKRFPLDMLTHPACLADFGHAIKSGTTVENTIQSPNMFCAPERFHGANPSFESDMWSYTFIFAQLYLGTEVIWGENQRLIDRLVQTLGPFPDAWEGYYCGVGEPKAWWYDQLGQMPRPQLLGGVETLKAKIDRLRPEVCEDEKYHALAVMNKGFCIDPERRITAAQLLKDPSFNAVMSYYKV